MNDHGDDDGRLKFMEYDGHYSRYDIWGGPCPPGENHLIHPAFAKLFIDDDKQIKKLTAERFDDKINPRVEVIISRFVTVPAGA